MYNEHCANFEGIFLARKNKKEKYKYEQDLNTIELEKPHVRGERCDHLMDLKYHACRCGKYMWDMRVYYIKDPNHHYSKKSDPFQDLTDDESRDL